MCADFAGQCGRRKLCGADHFDSAEIERISEFGCVWIFAGQYGSQKLGRAETDKRIQTVCGF